MDQETTIVSTPAPETPQFATQAEYRAWKEGGYQTPEKPVAAAESAETETTSEAEAEEHAEAESVEESETSERKPQEKPAEQPKKGKQTASERISELVGERNAERQRREALEARLQALEAAAKAPQQQATQQNQPLPKEDALPPRPKLSDFDYDETKWVEADTQWLDKRDEIKQRQDQAKRAATEQQQRQRQFMESANTKYADFQQVVVAKTDLPITQTMAEFVMAEPDGVDIAYHLGKNPAEAARIAALSPGAQIAALGRLAGALSAVAAKTPETTRNTQPAPKPPKTLSSTAAAEQVSDLGKAKTQAEYREARKRLLGS